MIDKDTLRRDRNALVQELERAGAQFRGNACRCPFHEDHKPSGGIFERDGVWRYKCLACGVGGDVYDIRAKLSETTPGQAIRETTGMPEKTKSDIMSHFKTQPQTFGNLLAIRQFLQAKVGRIVSEHTYTSSSGDTVQIVFRCESAIDGKTYKPVHLTDKGYCLGFAPKPWPLYNLPSVSKAETVVVVEGEKCAETLIRYGFTATTSAGGAKNARNTDWTPLTGKKVILWPDCDTEGRRYILDVEQILQSLQQQPRISILDPAGLDLVEKEDVVDFIEQLKVLNRPDAEITAAIAEALKKARAVSVATEIQQRLADITAGRYVCIDWSWDYINRFTRALLPGTVTLLVGNPGASKSFMGLASV